MSESFHVDPAAMTKSSGSFSDYSSALSSANDAVGAVQFMAGNAYYQSYGTDYQNAYRQLVKNLLPPMVTKTSDIATALKSSGTSYVDQDTDAASGISNSGAGA